MIDNIKVLVSIYDHSIYEIQFIKFDSRNIIVQSDSNSKKLSQGSGWLEVVNEDYWVDNQLRFMNQGVEPISLICAVDECNDGVQMNFLSD